MVELAYFDHYPSLVPFKGVGTHLVLYADMVTNRKGRKSLGVLRPAFSASHVAIAQRIFPSREGLAPSAVRLIFAGRNRDEVPNRMTEYAHGGGELGVPVRRVPVLKHRTLECVSVKGTGRAGVVQEKALDRLHTHFCATVAMGVCHGGEAMMDTPVLEESTCGCCRKFGATI